jgi:hypothetical protein
MSSLYSHRRAIFISPEVPASHAQVPLPLRIQPFTQEARQIKLSDSWYSGLYAVGHRQTDEEFVFEAGQVPWRAELHDPPKVVQLTVYFGEPPKPMVAASHLIITTSPIIISLFMLTRL